MNRAFSLARVKWLIIDRPVSEYDAITYYANIKFN